MNKVVPRIAAFLPLSLITALAIWAHVGWPFVVFLAVVWLSYLGIVLFAPRKPLEEKQSLEMAVIPEDGDPALWFAAMEYYLLVWNRTYKVFVTGQGLFGAKVRGVVTNPALATSKMSAQAYWVNTKSSQVYSQLQLASDAFLKVNSSNFRLLWAGVSAIDYLPGRKWGMGNVPHSGRLVIRLRSGQERELILLGQQDGEALKHRLHGYLQR